MPFEFCVFDMGIADTEDRCTQNFFGIFAVIDLKQFISQFRALLITELDVSPVLKSDLGSMNRLNGLDFKRNELAIDNMPNRWTINRAVASVFADSANPLLYGIAVFVLSIGIDD